MNDEEKSELEVADQTLGNIGFNATNWKFYFIFLFVNLFICLSFHYYLLSTIASLCTIETWSINKLCFSCSLSRNRSEPKIQLISRVLFTIVYLSSRQNFPNRKRFLFRLNASRAGDAVTATPFMNVILIKSRTK